MPDASLIFLSHASEDKEVVEAVAAHIPQSHLFVDIRTIDPGEDVVQAMNTGVEDAALFCLFLSPTSIKKKWVRYETTLATLKKVKGGAFDVLVVPIKGASYADAPRWMQRYFAVPGSFTPFDIARTIRGRHEDTLRAAGKIATELFAGREEMLDAQLLRLRSMQAQSGTFINVLIVSGFQRIGRRLFSQRLTEQFYPGGRSYGPILELPPFADAIDLYFALRETRLEATDFAKFKDEFRSFGSFTDAQQAQSIVEELDHYGEINQQVIVRSGFGLRDRSRELKGWTRELFELLRHRPNTRLVWLSERLIPEDVLAGHNNVAQIGLPEISRTAAASLLMKLVSQRDLSPLIVEEMCKRTGGHPGTIHFLAYLINERHRSPEALLHESTELLAFQYQLLKELFESLESSLQIQLLHSLAMFPSLDFKELCELVGGAPVDVARALRDLADAGLVIETADSGYSMPEVVRPAFLRAYGEAPETILVAANSMFQREFASGGVTKATVDKLLFARVMETGKLPPELADVVSPAVLHQLVRTEYERGSAAKGVEFKEAFARAAALSVLADVLPMPQDTCEEILFWGADATIRIGGDPAPIIKMMSRRGLPSVNYVEGFYEYQRFRNLEKAAHHLRRALQLRAFTLRSARLLARVYLDDSRPAAALEVIDGIDETRVRRDSGLLSQKIRALRMLGRNSEADALMPTLRALNDQYGEFELMQAQRYIRNGNRPAAYDALDRAELRPRANKHNIRFLRCIWQLDESNFSTLDEATTIASAAGRTAEVHHLRAKAAMMRGQLDEAYRLVHQIEKPNRLDLVLQARILEALLANKSDGTDAERVNWQEELNAVTVATRRR